MYNQTTNIMEDFRINEWPELHGVFVMAHKLMSNKKMIDQFHMTEDLELESLMAVMVQNIIAYADKHGVGDFSTDDIDTIKKSYDFLKNKNFVTSQEENE